MTSTKEMTKRLSEILGREVKSPFNIAEEVRDRQEASKVGNYLVCELMLIEDGCNSHFCGSGLERLTESYTALCKRFPEVRKGVRKEYGNLEEFYSFM